MSDAFKDREKGFEAKYKLDQEIHFKVGIRGARLFGHWAAGRLGLGGTAAEEYAKKVVEADFDSAGDSAILAKVAGDLADNGTPMREAEIKAALAEARDTARNQIVAEIESGKQKVSDTP